jgi:hypothetical protein
MSASLFISHATQDAKVAARLCEAMEARGFSCWIASRDIAPGENFQVAIVRAIRAAKIMLLVFTGAANGSDEVAKELALASQNKMIVVPLRVENIAPSETFAYEFATRQWIDFHTDWPRAVEQLARYIGGVLSAEPKAASPDAPVFASVTARPRKPTAGRLGALVVTVLVLAAVVAAAVVVLPSLTHKPAPPPAAAQSASPTPPPASNSEVPF